MKKLELLLTILVTCAFFITCTKTQLETVATANQSSNANANPDVPDCGTGYHWDFYLRKCVPNCPVGQHNDSITGACVVDGGGGGSTSVSLQTQPCYGVNTKNTMISAFNNLAANGVNLTELSLELGLAHTITIDSIDFNNITMTWDANDPAGKAISAPFKSNSNTNTKGYGFTMYTNGFDTIMPTMIRTYKNHYLKYYDLTTDGWITTINNYNLSSYTISGTFGGYLDGGAMKAQFATGCGQRTMNCMIDLYSNHGWLSVWATVQTAFIPATAGAVAATCAVHNCLLN